MFLIFLLINIKCFEEPVDASLMGDKILEMTAGEFYRINFDQINGIFSVRQIGDCTINYKATNPVTHDEMTGSLSDSSIALFFAKWTGKIEIKANAQTKISFSWATFPKICQMFYFDNHISNNLIFSNRNMSICYFNAAGIPLNYHISLNSEGANSIHIFNSSGKIPTNHAHRLSKHKQTYALSAATENIIDETYDFPTVLYVNESFLSLNLKISVKKDSKVDNEYDGYLEYEKPILIAAEVERKKDPKIKTIVGVIMGFFVFVLIFSTAIWAYKRRTNLRRQFFNTIDTEDISETESRMNTPERIQIEENFNSGAEINDDIVFMDPTRDFPDEIEGYPETSYQPPESGILIPPQATLNETLDDPNRMP